MLYVRGPYTHSYFILVDEVAIDVKLISLFQNTLEYWKTAGQNRIVKSKGLIRTKLRME